MLYELKNLCSRAASAENPQALPGAGGTAQGGRKGAPCIVGFMAGSTVTLLDADGPGMIRHIWCTIPPGNAMHLRNLILRIHWDHQQNPSVEAPLGDFFGVAHGVQRHMSSDLLSSLGGKAFNCWIPMPFRSHATVTVENDSGSDVALLFYQVDFTLGDELDDSTGYFHAQFRRENPCPFGRDYEILSVSGKGVYLGTVLGVRSLFRKAWWGEGEVKFYIDGEDLPTICGTGTEDYVGYAWGLEQFGTPLQGCPYMDNDKGYYSFYRLHSNDPIYFNTELRVTVQQIGYGSGGEAAEFYKEKFVGYPAAGAQAGDECYYDRSDDYSSVAYWYQALPTLPFPELPGCEARSANLP